MEFKLESFIKQNKNTAGVSGADFCESTLERKFIIMSRIAVALRRKGLHAALSIQPSNYCNIYVTKHDGDDCVIVSDATSYDATESELLEWWSAIENGVE